MPKSLTLISHILSTMFSPLACPTYAMAFALTQTYLEYATARALMTTLAVTALLTLVLPLGGIAFLYRLRLVSNIGLNERRERTIPFVIAVICYYALTVYLGAVHAPEWLTAFVWASLAAAVFTLFVNLKWKISGHATGMGGLCAFFFFVTYRGYLVQPTDLWFMGAVLVAGAVMSSRLILNRHTPAQIAAGFCSGFFFVTIFQIIFK